MLSHASAGPRPSQPRFLRQATEDPGGPDQCDLPRLGPFRTTSRLSTTRSIVRYPTTPVVVGSQRLRACAPGCHPGEEPVPTRVRHLSSGGALLADAAMVGRRCALHRVDPLSHAVTATL